MSARHPEPCEGIRSKHTGPVRFYLTGWRRATPHTYRAAKAAVNNRKEHPNT